MHLTGLDLFYWVAGFVGHSILLLVLLVRRRFREFPVFTLWIASNLLRTAALFFVAAFGNSALYYYAYWSMAAIDTILQAGVIYEMYSRTFRPVGKWAEDIRGALLWLLILSVVLAALLTALSAPRAKLWVESATIRGNLFSSLWMSELFIAMIVIAAKVGLPWKAHVVPISLGLGAYSLFGVAIAAGNSYFGLEESHHIFTLLAHYRMTIYLVCLLGWILTLWKDSPPPEAMSEELSRQLVALQASVRRDLALVRQWRHK